MKASSLSSHASFIGVLMSFGTILLTMICPCDSLTPTPQMPSRSSPAFFCWNRSLSECWGTMIRSSALMCGLCMCQYLCTHVACLLVCCLSAEARRRASALMCVINLRVSIYVHTWLVCLLSSAEVCWCDPPQGCVWLICVSIYVHAWLVRCLGAADTNTDMPIHIHSKRVTKFISI